MRLKCFLIFLIISTVLLPGTLEKEFLVIKSRIKNCKVYINNTYAGIPGEGGLLIVPLQQGNFEITIKSFFYKSFRKNITIGDLSYKLKYNPKLKFIFNPIVFLSIFSFLFVSFYLRNYYRKKSSKYFGRFKLIDEIGKGGIATIYKSYDKKKKRDIALKIMDKDKIGDSDLVEKFLREGKVISIIKNRFPDTDIVNVYEYGTMKSRNNTPYISMEFIKGKPLTDMITKGLPINMSIEIILKLANILDKCHKSGIYHRDLSPDNVIIEEESSRLVLIDFGIAKNEFTSYRTLDGSIAGKPVYMSPEQCKGEKIGPPTDIYTLGILFYLLIEGVPPFTGSNPMEVINKQINMKIPHFSKPVDPRIRSIVEYMTKKKASQRIDVPELIETLSFILENEELSIEKSIFILTKI